VKVGFESRGGFLLIMGGFVRFQDLKRGRDKT
jgi:hypothetical protein